MKMLSLYGLCDYISPLLFTKLPFSSCFLILFFHIVFFVWVERFGSVPTAILSWGLGEGRLLISIIVSERLEKVLVDCNETMNRNKRNS